MTTISTLELPVRLTDVFARLASGEEFLVTDHGRPVARILPPEPANGTHETAAEWVARWYAWTDSHPKREIVIDDSRESIYAGRGE